MANKMWVVTAIATAACWGMTYMLAGKIIKLTDKNVYLAVTSIANTVIFSLLAINSGTIGSVSWTAWALIGIATVLSVVGNALSIYSIELSDPVRAASVEVTYPLWCMVFSLLLAENTTVTPKTVIGSMLVIAGIVFLINEK